MSLRDLLLALALAPGCIFDKGPVGEGPHCVDTPTDVALDEVTPLGFAAADVLARLPAEEVVPFTWDDGTETELSLVFRPDAAARFVDSEAVYPDDGEQPAIAVLCDDRVEVDVSWDFASADGAFDEVLDTPLAATAVDAARMLEELELEALGGTFDLDDWAETEEYDERSAWVDVAVGDGATAGVVHGQVSGGDDDCREGQVCTAWAERVDVGTWGMPTR